MNEVSHALIFITSSPMLSLSNECKCGLLATLCLAKWLAAIQARGVEGRSRQQSKNITSYKRKQSGAFFADTIRHLLHLVLISQQKRAVWHRCCEFAPARESASLLLGVYIVELLANSRWLIWFQMLRDSLGQRIKSRAAGICEEWP